MFRCVVGFRKP